MLNVVIHPGSALVAQHAVDLFGTERVSPGGWLDPVVVRDVNDAEADFAVEFFRELNRDLRVTVEGRPWKLVVGPSCHGNHAVEVSHAPSYVRRIIKVALCENRRDERAYILHKNASAFLQGEDEPDGWMLVEFWTDDPQKYQPFVDYLNERIREEWEHGQPT